MVRRAVQPFLDSLSKRPDKLVDRCVGLKQGTAAERYHGQLEEQENISPELIYNDLKVKKEGTVFNLTQIVSPLEKKEKELQLFIKQHFPFLLDDNSERLSITKIAYFNVNIYVFAANATIGLQKILNEKQKDTLADNVIQIALNTDFSDEELNFHKEAAGYFFSSCISICRSEETSVTSMPRTLITRFNRERTSEAACIEPLAPRDDNCPNVTSKKKLGLIGS